MQEPDDRPEAGAEDPMRALREAFAQFAERLTPDIEPAPVYSPRPPDAE